MQARLGQAGRLSQPVAVRAKKGEVVERSASVFIHEHNVGLATVSHRQHETAPLSVGCSRAMP